MPLMKPINKRKEPELENSYPVWFHPNGAEMRVAMHHRAIKHLTLAGNSTVVQISPKTEKHDGEWYVDHDTVHETGARSRVSTVLSFQEMQAAFGISQETGESGDVLIDRLGGDSSQAGVYHRWRNCVNIPCAGTGRNGDPNVSILITDSIKGEVIRLLSP